ncbi:---NA---, partial [Paramuricea clavata]
ETMNTSKRFGDAGQPNAEEKALGSCPICPSFSFKSKTEMDRHQSMFHRHQKIPSKEVQHIYCSFEGCGKSFGS